MRLTIEEVISQLQSIKSHCEDMEDKEDPEDIWRADAIALNIAIKIIKKEPASSPAKTGPSTKYS